MSETSETVFSVTLGENNTKSLTLVVDPRLSCLDDSYAVHENTKIGNPYKPLCILLGVIVGIIVGLTIALWLKTPILFSMKTDFTSCGIVWESSHFNAWPLVALFLGFLAFIITLYWIWSRHTIRMEKIAAEERKQRFDMRKFLVEKSIDHAEKQAKVNKNNDVPSKYSVSITVNKKGNADKPESEGTDAPRSPNPNDGSPPPNAPSPMPVDGFVSATPWVGPSSETIVEAAGNHTTSSDCA